MALSDNAVEITVLAGATGLGALAMVLDGEYTQTIITAVIAIYTLIGGYYWGGKKNGP